MRRPARHAGGWPGCCSARITFVMSLDRTAMRGRRTDHPARVRLHAGADVLDPRPASPGPTRCCRCRPAGSPSASVRAACCIWANLLWSVLTAATPLGFSFASFIVIRGAARRRAVGGLAKLHRRDPPLVPAQRARQGQLDPARRPVSRPDRRGADHHLGHPAFRLALGVLRLRPARHRARHRVVVRGSATIPAEHPDRSRAAEAAPSSPRPADDRSRTIPPGAFGRCLRGSDAVLGDRRAVFLPGDDPEFLHDLAAHLPGERSQFLARGDGHLCLAALGRDVRDPCS